MKSPWSAYFSGAHAAVAREPAGRGGSRVSGAAHRVDGHAARRLGQRQRLVQPGQDPGVDDALLVGASALPGHDPGRGGPCARVLRAVDGRRGTAAGHGGARAARLSARQALQRAVRRHARLLPHHQQESEHRGARQRVPDAQQPVPAAGRDPAAAAGAAVLPGPHAHGRDGGRRAALRVRRAHQRK